MVIGLFSECVLTIKLLDVWFCGIFMRCVEENASSKCEYVLCLSEPVYLELSSMLKLLCVYNTLIVLIHRPNLL